MKKTLLLIFIVIISTNIIAQTITKNGSEWNIKLVTAGTLAQIVGGELYSITKLILSGPVNIDDMWTLKNMAGNRNSDDNVMIYCTGYDTPGKLANLDISGVEGLSYIGAKAFEDCKSLVSIILPFTVLELRERAFGRCINLTSIYIHKNIAKIAPRTFEDCQKISSFSIDENNTNFKTESGVLFSKDGLTLVSMPCGFEGDYSIPVGVKKVLEYAFNGCNKIKKVTISNTIFVINYYAFAGCEMTEIIIPNNVNTIAYMAFSECVNITKMELPNSLTYIMESAFSGCSSLKEISIPKSLNSMGRNVFYGCSELSIINVDAGNANYKTIDNVLYSKDGTNLILFPRTKEGEFNIPYGVVKLESAVFDGCTKLTKVTIPNSVKIIDESVFRKCTYLTEVIIPNSVIEIGYNTFSECVNLKQINLPSSLSKISTQMFMGCSALQSIEIPNSVLSIERNGFLGCSNLKEISIPNSVTEIGWSAFAECSSLKSIILPNAIKTIPFQCFQECINLESINIPNTVNSIGDQAFFKCKAIKCITVPELVENIYRYTFSGCTSLKEISLPSSIKEIGEYAFADCSALTTIKLSSIVPPVVQVNSFGSWSCGCPVNKSICVLEVPKGSKAAYKSAVVWKDFINVIESTTDINNQLMPDIEVIISDKQIRISNCNKNVTLTFIDMSGRIVEKFALSSNESRSISTLINGVYILLIETESGKVSKKIIV